MVESPKAIPTLRRRLGLPLLVLYGTGVAVGAGIYVLVGAVAQHAGAYAPWAFLIAALVMGLTVASYAELCTRIPVAAGEAAYVKSAFNSRFLSLFTGLAMIGTAVIASATVAVGSSGYILQFIDAPRPLVISIVLVVLGLVSIAGVLESVLLASLFTVIEVGGLFAIIGAGVHAGVDVSGVFVVPSAAAPWAGIAYASLLAFFAFIGFEDLTNMVEETKAPERTLPLALVLTLLLTTVLYVAVVAVAVSAVPLDRLVESPAPLSLVFRQLAGVSPAVISLIAIVATLNTVLAEMTMASRVVYGLARLGELPEMFGRVHARTATPVAATGFIIVATVLLALLVPLERLAELTSMTTLIVFAMVNLALLRLRYRHHRSDTPHIRLPIWMPAAGFVSCVLLIAAALIA